MLRILPWNPATGFEKLPAHDRQFFASDASPSPSPNSSLNSKTKRSVDSPSRLAAAETKAVKPVVVDVVMAETRAAPSVASTPVTAETGLSSSAPEQPPSVPVNVPTDNKEDVNVDKDVAESCPIKVKTRQEAQMATMRQTISTQLNLEILLKHRELRLIDQEIAKCQVALEQLRRCSEIPFPATQKPSEQVSSGKGAAVRKTNEKSQARSPAPWGVTNGPYSRHYAKWLLQDPYFDGGESQSARLLPVHGHSTRGHHTDFAQLVGKTSRSNRALHGGLPPGYAEPKQKPTGPMILKRKSDGKMVKLVCPDCHRFDFGSAQGFINHCRIGHQRNFATHDAAAEGCGQALDDTESVAGNATTSAPNETPGPAKSLNTPVTEMPPALSTPIVVATAPSTPSVTPTVQSQPALTLTTVHPLVKSAHNTPREVLSKPLVPGGFVPKSERKARKPKSTTQPACPATPNLSAYIEQKGYDINLQVAVEDAKTKVEPEFDYMDLLADHESPIPTPSSAGGRHPHGAGNKHLGKSVASGGKSRKRSFAQHCESMLGPVPELKTPDTEIPFEQFTPLLPSPTNDSTQAPSLIDDDEEMEPQSPPSSDENDDSEVLFHVRDDEHSEDNTEMRHEINAPASTCVETTQPSQPTVTRPPSARKDRPFTFITENPYSSEQERKRRRLGD